MGSFVKKAKELFYKILIEGYAITMAAWKKALEVYPNLTVPKLIAISFFAFSFLFGLYILITLPRIIKLEDYKPRVVSEVFDRNGKKIGEFFRQKRILTPIEDIPEHLINAFVAAEDAKFFEHKGINALAILRALVANIKAGKKVQGASTITQQVARALVLTREKTYTRKLKEIILALWMERHLTKKEILYIYLNEIYLGHGSYGVNMGARIYFKKELKDISLKESALLAGLPQAPSRYSPVYNPSESKKRQIYVLKRMLEESYITEEEYEENVQAPVEVNIDNRYVDSAPFFIELIRQLLLKRIDENTLLNEGIKIYTSIDMEKQKIAEESLKKGLREVDKRQGYRGPLDNLSEPQDIVDFLEKQKEKLLKKAYPKRTILPEGTFEHVKNQNTDQDEKPEYLKIEDIVKGIITFVDDKLKLVHVKIPGGKGLIDFETMKWARKPNPDAMFKYDEIHLPSEALNKGDVVLVKISKKEFESETLNELLSEKPQLKKEIPKLNEYYLLHLEQEPIVEGALFSLNQSSELVEALVGGMNFKKSKFNRVLQAKRQTGSAFKPLVYLTALKKGFKQNTKVYDIPVIYEEKDESVEEMEGEEQIRKWKPKNHSKRFSGEILFRNAIIRSLNVPTIKITEKIGVEPVAELARKLGIFSRLNLDYTIGLGSSSVTLYEMTKVFSRIGKLGKEVNPLIILEVKDRNDELITEKVYLDEFFNKKSKEEESLEEKKEDLPTSFVEEDPEEKDLDEKTTYLMIDLLRGVVEDPSGTGKRALEVQHPVAGKTGTTDGYYDAWFLGFSPYVATGVWVGFDQERSLGRGETGGRAALPVWTAYMRATHKDLPKKEFPVPEGIVFVNVDSETGLIATPSSTAVTRQAFVEGTEPQEMSRPEEDKSFFKEDLSE